MSGQMTLLPGKVPTKLGVGGLLMVMVLLLCGALVVYPVVFLVAESLNTGEPGVFPPPEMSRWVGKSRSKPHQISPGKPCALSCRCV